MHVIYAYTILPPTTGHTKCYPNKTTPNASNAAVWLQLLGLDPSPIAHQSLTRQKNRLGRVGGHLGGSQVRQIRGRHVFRWYGPGGSQEEQVMVKKPLKSTQDPSNAP